MMNYKYRPCTLLAVFLATSASLPSSLSHGDAGQEQHNRLGRHRQLLDFDAGTNAPRVHVDLAEEYQLAEEEHPLKEAMLQVVANADDTINAFVALECGQVVAEDYKTGFDDT